MIFDELYVDTLSSVARAVQTQDIQLLQELLRNGHPTNVPDNRGWTPLHVAASEGCVEALRLLLTADDVQVEGLCHRGLTPLYLACRGKTESHYKVVALLLSAGAEPDMTSGDQWDVPLHAATENNSLEMVRMLLDAGADPNLRAFKNTTALHSAAEVGALEVAQLLLAKGANLNISHEKVHDLSALHCLCLQYIPDRATIYNDMLDLFLAHGSDVNAQTSDGTTPLMLAVQEGWERAVDRLLEHKADVYLIKNDGRAKNSFDILVLHFAIQFSADTKDSASQDGDEQDDTTILQKILSRTSHDKIPREGYSIFHLAIQWSRYKGLRMLIEDGLHPDEFQQSMESGIIDCDDVAPGVVPLVVEINTHLDTPLGFLLFQSLSREVVDTAKYMIDKGSSINALKPDVLPPLVAALKNRHPTAYEEDGLGQEILQYLLARGVDIMYKTRESDLLPDALAVSSLFNVVGFFRLLQHGVPAQRIYTRDMLTALLHHYQNEPLYEPYRLLPWLVVSWLHTANLFITQLPADTIDIFNTDWGVSDENLTEAWHQLGAVIACPKSLQHLCVLTVRRVLGESKGWEKLQDSLGQLQAHSLLPEPLQDMLSFKWVKTSTLLQCPPSSSRHLYYNRESTGSSDEEVT